ncbi:MAG: sugar transferase [Actinomycetia bacterium]|nr:sugar transferase [Actinomycetes bacterium]
MIKRSIDLVLATLGLLLTAPITIVVALIIRMSMGSPVIFRQTRSGLHVAPFTIYKFRTMASSRNKNDDLLPDEERLTSFGKFIRNYSLDELPTFLNVIKGDMSLVGPRPLLTAYLQRYTPEQQRRHQVKPGITGWAQINGRNTISWSDKFKLDVWYVDNRSLKLDIKIMWITLIKVLKQEGISAQQHATMPEFRGDNELNECTPD